jgi:hypothetical protein
MRRLLAIVVVALLMTMGGCGSKRDATPAGEFDAKHGGKTDTPYGVVVPGSARDAGAGNVIFQTEDGTKHEVQRLPDGSYSPPKKVE